MSRHANVSALERAFALGVPLLGYVTYQNGPWIGLLVLVAGMSVLRWPVYFAARWLSRRDTGR